VEMVDKKDKLFVEMAEFENDNPQVSLEGSTETSSDGSTVGMEVPVMPFEFDSGGGPWGPPQAEVEGLPQPSTITSGFVVQPCESALKRDAGMGLEGSEQNPQASLEELPSNHAELLDKSNPQPVLEGSGSKSPEHSEFTERSERSEVSKSSETSANPHQPLEELGSNPSESRENSTRLPGDEPDDSAPPPPPRTSARPPKMPAFVEGVDDEDRVDPPPTFVPNSEKIRKMVEEKATPVRAGADYPIERNFPKWRTSGDLSREARKPINWQVSNLWTERAKILLAAEQKSGKTWIILHAAICVASGRPLFGHDRFRVLTPGPVGIVAGEDDPGEVGRRLDRMCRAAGLLMSDLPIHFLEGHGMRLNRQRDQEIIKSAVRALGLKLIIYDPLARLMDGDENSKEVVAALLNPASQLALDENVSVCVVHHLGKQNNENPRSSIARVRGSSDITSWFSCGMFLQGQMRGGKLTVEIVQRTSGNVPNEFPVYVREDQDTSVHGLGSMRLEADLAVQEQDQRGRNQQLIEESAREILALVRGKARDGVTLSEIQVHLGYGRALTYACVKKLVREERVIAFEDAEDIPEKKVLVPVLQARRPEVPRRAPEPGVDDDDDDDDPPTGQGSLPIN